MNTQNEMDLLKNEIERLSKKVEEIEKNDISEDLLDKLENLAQKINIEEFRGKIPEEKIEELKEKSKEVIKEFEDFAKNHPFATILGAAAIGYLIGKVKK